MGDRLKIAQVAPLYESVPPKFYGGTERVVSYLTEELVRMGQDVTLFASGDSITSANLVPWGQKALRLDCEIKEPVAAHAGMLDLVQSMQDDYDVIHFHCDFVHFPLLRHLRPSCLSTLHGRLDQKEVHSLYRRFPRANLVSISHSQRRPLMENHWVGNIYHGLPPKLYTPNFKGGDYFAFLGRVSPEKGLESAIDIALRSNSKLKIAAKIDHADKRYFDEVITPKLSHPLIEFIGEIGETEKTRFLGNAKALLFPIRWPEPFGMVMIESMACATPVLAFDQGSVAEVVSPGVSGIIVNSVERALERMDDLLSLDRVLVRREFERRFSQNAMARNYLCLYQGLVNSKRESDLVTERELELFL